MNNKINNTYHYNGGSTYNLLNLSTSTFSPSIETKATRAAEVAQTECSLRKTSVNSSVAEGLNKRKERHSTELECDLRIIRSAFEHANLDRTELKVSKPSAGSSAVCVITTWHKDEKAFKDGGNTVQVWRQEEEKDHVKGHVEKIPDRTYVFYPSSIDCERLGSVAIYGSNVVEDYESIRRKGNLFGIEVRSVSVEMGRRPFLDVTFRA